MDGISVAASVLAIATAGVQVSIKLVSLSNQVATARNRITSIGNDVSLTASILQQLAELMTKGDGDGEGKMNVFSVEGLRTARAAADACHGTFQELTEVLKKSCRQLQERNDNAAIGKRVKLSKFEKLKWPFLQPSIDALCVTLESARGTLMLILQVATLAYAKKLAELNPSSQLSVDDQSLLIGAIVALHRKKSPSAGAKVKIVESEGFEAHCDEDPEGLNLKRNTDLVVEGNRIPSPISAPVSPKAESFVSHAFRPDISGVSGPQKVSDNLQAKERFQKAEPELNESKMERLQSHSVEIGNKPAKKESIKFKDAVGRNYEFPFQFCNTWPGMEDLIKQAFLPVEVIGPHVIEGHYDLVDPRGNIILPQVWESLVEPNWTVTMHMWPLPENISPEEIPPEVREAGKADPGMESANPEQTTGRLEDHVEVWILQPQIHPIHCGYDIRYGASKPLISKTDSRLRRRKFRRWKRTNVVNQLTKLLTKEREAVDQLCANIMRDWLPRVELTTLDIVFRRMKPSKEPNTSMPWRSIILYIQIGYSTDPRSKALDAGQDQTRVRSKNIVEYKDLGSSVGRSEKEDSLAIAKSTAQADGEVIIVKAADEGSTVAGKAMSGSPSSSRFETDISSVQSGETSDDEESENVTPEMARKIVDNLLAEYTTLHV